MEHVGSILGKSSGQISSWTYEETDLESGVACSKDTLHFRNR